MYRQETQPDRTEGDSSRSRQTRIVQNFLLIWLDPNIDESNKDFSHSLKKLRQTVNTIDTFTDPEKCINSLADVEDEKVFMIMSGSLGQQTISKIHYMSQIDSIYIFCGDKARHEYWAKEWSKVKGVYTDMRSICEALNEHTRQCDRDSTSFRISNAKDPNQLEPTFMYTTLFKEIILEIKYDQQAIKTLANECRQNYANNEKELKIIQEFEQEYYQHTPVWWYTRECFTYQMLNRALRTFEVDIIVSMGVFIQHLHHRIQQLHSEQRDNFDSIFTVYRGQGLLTTHFDTLKESQGGLLAFNNFLSTSTNRKVSYKFARDALKKTDHVGILFQMTIDSSITTSPFALLKTESFFEGAEKEILFSMNSVFRIGQLKQLDNSAIFEVELTLTTPDTDALLQGLTQRIREEVEGSTGWHRMGRLLHKSGHFKKAEELYQSLIERTSEDNLKELSDLNHMLAKVYASQHKYEEALKLHENAIEIKEKYLSPDDLDFATSYTSLGETHEQMGEHVKALQYYTKSLEIRQQMLHPDHLDLAVSYDNIGSMHRRMGEHHRALEYSTKALEIRQKSLPQIHSDVASSYNNLGTLYMDIGEYTKALEHLQKSHEIFKKSLPPYHPDLFMSYNNLGDLHKMMGERLKALEYYENGIKISEKSLPLNDLNLALRYEQMGCIFLQMEEKSRALEYFIKSLEIRQKSLPPTHPDLGLSYNNVGAAYNDMGDGTKAVGYFEKAIDIYHKSSPLPYVDLARAYQNIAETYCCMGDRLKRVEYTEKSIAAKEKHLLPNHPELIGSYSSIAKVYTEMENYWKALEYEQKVHEIFKKSLSPKNADLGSNYHNMGFLYHQLGKYKEAFRCSEKAIEIREKCLPPNHPDLAQTFETFIQLCDQIGKHSKALEYNQKFLEILKNILPPIHVGLGLNNCIMGELYYQMAEYSKALEYYGKSLEIQEKLFPPNYIELFVVNSKMSEVCFQMGEPSKGHVILLRCLDIQRMSPDFLNHGVIAYRLGKLYRLMKNYSLARTYFERTLEIETKAKPETCPIFPEIYCDVGDARQLTGDYSNALLSLQKVLEIDKTRPCYRTILAWAYNYMGETYYGMRNYSATLEFHKKALAIREKIFSSNHPDLAATYHNLAKVYIDINQYKLAHEHAHRAFEIARQKFPETHPKLLEYKDTLTKLQHPF